MLDSLKSKQQDMKKPWRLWESWWAFHIHGCWRHYVFNEILHFHLTNCSYAWDKKMQISKLLQLTQWPNRCLALRSCCVCVYLWSVICSHFHGWRTIRSHHLTAKSLIGLGDWRGDNMFMVVACSSPESCIQKSLKWFTVCFGVRVGVSV